MSGNPFASVLRSIRNRFGLAASDSPDAMLLERYVLLKDEEAFAALVERHGAMVWGTCRRVAGDAHAEDAFQATWLVLTRKARSLRDAVALACWLHRVAFRLSLAARSRPTFPLVEAAARSPGPEDEVASRETRAVIDEEVERLPEKYRLPVVLCFFHGRTHAEAAAELGWPLGTVAGRLARAKDLLHARLTRRGLAAVTFPLPVFLASLPVVTPESPRAAVLASALLAGDRTRRLVLCAGLLLLSLTIGALGVAAYRHGGPDHTPSPDPAPIVAQDPNIWTPKNRIWVDDGFAISPDGKQLAGSRNGRVRIFDLSTNKVARELDGEIDGVAHELRFSSDGKWLAVAGSIPAKERNQPSPVSVWMKVWNLNTGRGTSLAAQPLTDPSWRYRLVDFHPNSDQLITGFDEKGFDLWDLATGKRLKTFSGNSASLSADGKTLGTWDDERKVTRLWDLASEESIVLHDGGEKDPQRLREYRERCRKGHQKALMEEDPSEGTLDPNSCLLKAHVGLPVFHPNGELVAAAGDSFLRLWERKTGKLFEVIQPYLAVNKLTWENLAPEHMSGIIREHRGCHLFPPSFSPDGEILSVSWSGGGSMLWSVRSNKVLCGLEGQVVSFSPDGKKIATRVRKEKAGEVHWSVKWWDTTSGKHLSDAPEQEFVNPPQEGNLLPNGRAMITREKTPSGTRIHLWDTKTGKERGRTPLALTGYDGGGLAFSRDGKTLVSVIREKATLWERATGARKEVPEKATASLDGLWVSFEKEPPIELHSPLQQSLSPRDLVTPRVERVRQLGSPDGRLRVSLGYPEDLKFTGSWVDSGRKDEQDPEKRFPGISFSSVRWTKEEDEVEGGPWGNYDQTAAAAFSPDGHYLALGFADGTILLWDISPPPR